MSEHNNGDLVNVPVPRRYVMDVYQFLAEREQKAPSSSANKAINDNASSDDRTHWWAADNRIPRLKKEIENVTVLTLLDLTADHTANWISFEQIYQAAGRSFNQARADLGGLTVLIKRLFPNNTGGWWPVEIKEGAQIQYQMSEEIARQWKKS